MLLNLGLVAILLILYSLGIQWAIVNEVIIEYSEIYWGSILVFVIGAILILLDGIIKLNNRHQRGK
jgi:hypothetical protein